MTLAPLVFSQGKRSILRKAGSERIDHSMRVKFNPLALLLDSSLEGEYDLVQRVIYDVSYRSIWFYSVDPSGRESLLSGLKPQDTTKLLVVF